MAATYDMHSRGLEQENHELEASLGCITRPCLEMFFIFPNIIKGCHLLVLWQLSTNLPYHYTEHLGKWPCGTSILGKALAKKKKKKLQPRREHDADLGWERHLRTREWEVGVYSRK